MNRPAGQPEFEIDRLKQLLLRPETDRLEAMEDKVEALDQRIGVRHTAQIDQCAKTATLRLRRSLHRYDNAHAWGDAVNFFR